jgi:hypothetical protein|tara:strand:+ start:57 stop:212 length:156 start_codon:yes stop_codon:yes gene_type:complete
MPALGLKTSKEKQNFERVAVKPGRKHLPNFNHTKLNRVDADTGEPKAILAM